MFGLAFRDARSNLSADGSDLAFQAADAGFACVITDDALQRLIRKTHLRGAQSVFSDLARDEVAARDSYLLLVRVTGEIDDLHPIIERAGYGFRRVGSRDEEDLGKIEGDLQVVVAEFAVLFGVEDLEQCGGRVAMEVERELIDLIQHEHRILALDPSERLKDPAGQRADIRTPVTADLGLITHAAQ